LIEPPCDLEKRCIDTILEELLIAEMSSLVDLTTDITRRLVDENCHDLLDHEGEILIDDNPIPVDHLEAMIHLDIAIDLQSACTEKFLRLSSGDEIQLCEIFINTDGLHEIRMMIKI